MFFGAYSAVGEAQRLLGAKADTSKKPKYQKPAKLRVETDARDWRQCRDDRRQAEQEQVELIDRLASEPVGELALAQRTDEQPGHRDAADPRNLRLGDEAAFDQVGDESAEDREIQHVEKIAGGNKRQNLPMDRSHPRGIHRLADIRFDGLGRCWRRLCHLLSPP
jgi:hypothetical protein